MGVQITDPSIADLAFTDLNQGNSTLLPVADVRTGGDGVSGRVSPRTLQQYVQSWQVAATAHGLTSTDIGKPLSGTTVLDDISTTDYPTGVLVSVPDANTLTVSAAGTVQFSDTLMEIGYSIASDGPYIYWDASFNAYVSTRPADTNDKILEILYVTNVSGGTVTAEVLDWGPGPIPTA